MYLLSLVILGPYGRGEKVGNKWNNKSSETISLAVPYLGFLFCLVVESNHFCYVSLKHYTIIAQCRLHRVRQGEKFFVSSGYRIWIGVTIFMDYFIPYFLIGCFLLLIFFVLFVMLIRVMACVHSINFPCHTVIGTLSQVHSITG